ncbi:MAG: hypothetical protein HDT27_06455 [Subdoligranulum sp.]|nr:hypothetical protein [Subdoligranulum sp.]
MIPLFSPAAAAISRAAAFLTVCAPLREAIAIGIPIRFRTADGEAPPKIAYPVPEILLPAIHHRIGKYKINLISAKIFRMLLTAKQFCDILFMLQLEHKYDV